MIIITVVDWGNGAELKFLWQKFLQIPGIFQESEREIKDVCGFFTP